MVEEGAEAGGGIAVEEEGTCGLEEGGAGGGEGGMRAVKGTQAEEELAHAVEAPSKQGTRSAQMCAVVAVACSRIESHWPTEGCRQSSLV